MLCDYFARSRTIFFKKIKALTGQTPAEYIKTLRMNRAAELLREETITVAEVCYKVGINDPHYFAKVFKQQFGISPKNTSKVVKKNLSEKQVQRCYFSHPQRRAQASRDFKFRSACIIHE